MRQALALLASPDDGCTVVGIPAGGGGAAGHTFKGNDLDGLVRMAGVLGQRGNVYYCLNPTPVGFSRGAGVPKDEEILRRRWLLVDVDTVRPAKTKQGATDHEKSNSWPVAVAVHGYLAEHDWPEPVMIDSGNGWHLLYQCDLPNNDYAKRLVKTWINHLADRFDCEAADIDRVVYPAKQIAKLPGTWALKGSNLSDRPWRLAKLVDVPADLAQLVTGSMLVALVGEPAEGRRRAQPVGAAPTVNGNGVHEADVFAPPVVVDATAARLAAWVRAALVSECAVLALAILGKNLNTQLRDSAFRMGQLVPLGLDEAEARRELLAAAVRAGADNPRKDEDTLNRSLAAGKANPRDTPNFAQPHQAEVAADDLTAAGDPIIVWASEVEVKLVEWLWLWRIPLGKLTTFAGVGGLGKTFVLCQLAALLSRGLDWPDGSKGAGEPGRTLFISGEDDPDDTLVPRMIECGADLTKIAFLKAPVLDNFTLAAVKVLTTAIDQVGPETRLVVIDPPTSYLGGINDHKNAELRQLLTPLQRWVAVKRVSMIFNTHVNKPQGAKVEAMARVIGSVAWVNAVRAAHMFAVDPDDRERSLMVPMKSNLGPKLKGLAYKIVRTPDLAKIEWLGDVETTADEAVSGQKGTPRSMLATEWLIGLFRERLEWPGEDFWASARHHGISKNAIDEARVKLNIPKPRQTRNIHNKPAWVWWVTADWPPLHAQSGDVTEEAM